MLLYVFEAMAETMGLHWDRIPLYNPPPNITVHAWDNTMIFLWRMFVCRPVFRRRPCSLPIADIELR
jgi:hypothetical protein